MYGAISQRSFQLSRSAASSYLAAQLPAISQRSFQLSRSAASSYLAAQLPAISQRSFQRMRKMGKGINNDMYDADDGD
jgi:hypothetical protein